MTSGSDELELECNELERGRLLSTSGCEELDWLLAEFSSAFGGALCATDFSGWEQTEWETLLESLLSSAGTVWTTRLLPLSFGSEKT